MSSGLLARTRELRHWISALSATKRLIVLLGSGGVFFATQQIATAEEQEMTIVVIASAFSLVSVLIALYSLYAILRPFINSISLNDGEKN